MNSRFRPNPASQVFNLKVSNVAVAVIDGGKTCFGSRPEAASDSRGCDGCNELTEDIGIAVRCLMQTIDVVPLET